MLNGARRSGILFHPTSLPGGQGIGDLGAAAYRFVDWLEEAGQSYWQLLPLVAVDQGGSPYSGLSALAGNPWLIDLDALVEAGLLGADALTGAPDHPDSVDFAALGRWKEQRLVDAYRAFANGAAPQLRPEVEAYRRANAGWLDDYALFRAARAHHGDASWTEWESGLRRREPEALERWRAELADEVARYAFQQFLFDRHWAGVRRYANQQGIHIIGDIPIFVAHDSADVWANQELFELDEDGRPTVVSGVPPDYFSETGQRWGNPLYRWDVMRERGYRWWTERFRRTLEWVDVVRVDHFRGFEAYWEIDAAEETAINGRWVGGPGRDLFQTVERELGSLPIIAEDLGLITEEVEELRDSLRLPGMRVLQFGFDGEADNPHLPENYPARSVGYTGTHDNDTSVGWWRSASPEERGLLAPRITGTADEVHWELIRLVWESPAELVVAPLQDVLGLGSEARMNTPGTAADNWRWRLRELPSRAAARALREITARAGRLAEP